MKNKYAFTLIELLIATAIFAVVSIAIYSTFNSGMTIWRRAKQTGTVEQRVLLKTERMGRELRQSFGFKDIGFFGNKEKIQFPQVVNSELARVSYFFDKETKRIFRAQDNFADLLEQLEEEKGKEKSEEGHELLSRPVILLDNVEKMEFFFGYFKENSFLWKETWQQESLPQAVKLKLTTQDKPYETIIFIPTS